MNYPQSGILAAVPALARYMIFSCYSTSQSALKNSLTLLSDTVNGDSIVVGFGQSLLAALGQRIEGMREFPRFSGPGLDVPSTGGALWIWIRGDDRGEILHQSRAIEQMLSPAFSLDSVVDAFIYGDSRDLTGYEDGTENPKDEHAREVAIVNSSGTKLDASSFVAVQLWQHDFVKFDSMDRFQQNNVIGRDRESNEELTDAPVSAHVKRTAQESFDPDAFVLRRSMPWTDEMRAGLNFVAFGSSFDAFEALLRRMVGAEDGVVDGLFSFTRPLSGAYFWCPAIKDGRLDLRALGI